MTVDLPNQYNTVNCHCLSTRNYYE